MVTIAVSSFKGGTAKTSTVLHIGAGLARFHNKKVLLIDFDAQANLTTGLGFDPDENDSMASVLQGQKTFDEVVLHTPFENVHLVPADAWLERVEVTGALAADRYSHERLAKIVEPLDYDYVLIDTPPSLCWLTESALIASQYTVVCATPEFYSVKGLERLGQFIDTIAQRHPLDILAVILSFWNPRGKSNDAFTQVIERTFPDKLIETRIRRDIAVSEASVYGKPVFEVMPKSRAAEDYQLMIEELLTRLAMEPQLV